MSVTCSVCARARVYCACVLSMCRLSIWCFLMVAHSSSTPSWSQTVYPPPPSTTTTPHSHPSHTDLCTLPKKKTISDSVIHKRLETTGRKGKRQSETKSCGGKKEAYVSEWFWLTRKSKYEALLWSNSCRQRSIGCKVWCRCNRQFIPWQFQFLFLHPSEKCIRQLEHNKCRLLD